MKFIMSGGRFKHKLTVWGILWDKEEPDKYSEFYSRTAFSDTSDRTTGFPRPTFHYTRILLKDKNNNKYGRYWKLSHA